jgi:flagella basal body P-ring formation protein FlgA
MRSKLDILIELGLIAGVVCLGVLALTALVSADVVVPERDVVAAVRDYVRGAMQEAADVEITCRWRGDITVEGAGPVTLHVGPSSVEGSAGGAPVSLEVRRGGKTLRSLVITAETAYFDTVAVAARPLRHGEALTPDAVRFERREVTQMLRRTFSRAEELAGVRMRSMLPAGRVVDRKLTESVPLVRRGEMVTVLAEAGTITVSTQGKALSDGAAGDHIFVENGERQKIQGQVVRPGVVKVIF